MVNYDLNNVAYIGKPLHYRVQPLMYVGFASIKSMQVLLSFEPWDKRKDHVFLRPRFKVNIPPTRLLNMRSFRLYLIRFACWCCP